jgi:hypothetical protein
MSKSSKTIVFINDTHCGSNYGLMSDEAQHEDGRSVGMTYQQGKMLDHWKMVAKNWRNPDCIIFNGDLIDGSARADRGTSVWTPNLDTQAQDFKELYSYWGTPKILHAITIQLLEILCLRIKIWCPNRCSSICSCRTINQITIENYTVWIPPVLCNHLPMV